MKSITLAIMTLLLISCNYKKSDLIITGQKNAPVAEYLAKSIQTEEEIAQAHKRIEDIETFVYREVEKILNKNQIGKTFFIHAPDSIKAGGILEYKITYLGSIQIKGENIRFVSITSYAGNDEDSKRASSTITLFNGNKRIGYYYVGGAFDSLPQILNTNLMIKYADCSQTTTISFKDNIPQEIYVRCTEDGGDLYSFSKE